MQTGFSVPRRFISNKRLLFDLTDAPAAFQSALDVIQLGFRWNTCLENLDDVIIFTNAVEERFQHVAEILRIPQSTQVQIKLSKNESFRITERYFGHFVKPGRL